jgi:drug/metabolite transporter (DMT)-like permease
VLTGILAGLAAGALWGMVFVAPRMVEGFSAVDFTAGRFAAYGALSLLLMLLIRKSVWPTPRQSLAALGLSFLGFTGYYLLLAKGIQDAGTEVPSLIIGTIPIWMMLLGKPAGLRWAGLLPGLLLTALGLGLMVAAAFGVQIFEPQALSPQALSPQALNPQALSSPTLATQGIASHTGQHFWKGVAYAVLAMLLWTAFGLLNAAWLKKHPEVSATTWANWLGVATGLGALIMWFSLGFTEKSHDVSVKWSLFATLCIVTGIGSAWLATILWNMASQRLSASLCGQLIVSETIFALVYSFAWDGAWPSGAQWLACVLFVGGIRAHN